MRRATVFHLVCFIAFWCFSSPEANAQFVKWKAWEAEADTLYERQEFVEAAKLYSRIIEAASGSRNQREILGPLYKRAVCYYSTQAYDLALKDVDQFVDIYPSSPQPYILKAFVYRDLSDAANELLFLDKAIGMMPPNADFLKWRALLYLRKDEYRSSVNDILQARTMEDDPESETYLGIGYYNLGEKDSAYMAFNKSIELDATYAPAYLYAGSVSLQDDNYQKALTYLNLALKLDGHNKEALFYKGVALVEMKKVEEGCRFLNKAFYAGMDDASDYLEEYCFKTEE